MPDESRRPCHSPTYDGGGDAVERGNVRSTIAWLDHSDAQRRRMMEVVGLFRERNTVDDMGIGSVRDTFSDLLFPGTSTLHTRAKYLLFLPWICLRMEADRVPSRQGWERLKDLETQLIYSLLRGGETEGVIGRDARESLKQWPSFMYWGALGRHRIRLLPFNRGQYIASLDGFHRAQRSAHHTDDGDTVNGVPHTWHRELPAEEPGFLEATTFGLNQDQGSYLSDRILASASDSYLADLVQGPPVDDAPAPWAHPAAAHLGRRTREVVDHARRFSEAIQGASLLYNLMLAEAVREARSAGGTVSVDEDLVDTFRDRLDEWAELIEKRAGELATWDRTHFWQLVTDANSRVPDRTQRFIDRWLELVVMRGPGDLVDDDEVRGMIRRREFETKGTLARLRNARALERWQGSAGADQLTFRWGTVLPIVNEIVRGREGTDA